jgi:hypothetical protein
MTTCRTGLAGLLVMLAVAWGFAGATLAEARAQPRVSHVIIIGVDGMSTDGVIKADTPTLHDMMNRGSWTLHARGVLPTTSAANWASIITGAAPEQHGVTSNDWQVGEFNFPSQVTGSGGFFPSIFQILTEQHPKGEIGSIYQWEGFGNLYDKRFVDYDIHGKDEDETTALAETYIRSKRPEFLFVHLDHVDDAGHAHGHGSPLYYQAVAKADRLIGRIRQATIDAGIADRTVIFVTADHGGVGKGHGGQSLAELEIPWIVFGAGVKPGVKLDLPVNTFDTPATAAWLLGAKIPYGWIGRPVKSILVGEAAPQLAYRSSSFYAAPVISPSNDGNADAGGLFIDRPARMTLTNPNAVGEIRYTLDNAIPTAGSALYTGPFDLTRNTIVRAAVFVGGKPASMPSKAFVRILDLKGRDRAGVDYKVYLLPDPAVRLPAFEQLSPVASGVSHEFSLAEVKLPREDNVAVVFEGDLTIATGGAYDFSLASDDGSKLYVDGKPVVDNDGSHGVITAHGGVDLQPGKHVIRVEWFNVGGGAWLGAYYQGPGLPRQYIDPNALSRR